MPYSPCLVLNWLRGVHPPRVRVSSAAARISCVTLLIACLGGCGKQPTVTDLPVDAIDVQQPERDHFAVAIDFLKQRDEHNLERSADQTSYYLNRWIADQSADARWIVDRPFINTLPDAIKRAPATKEIASDRALAGLSFQIGDVLFLEECRWLHAVALSASRKKPPQVLSDWIQSRGLSKKAASQLATCFSLFDWTVRNVQLDDLLPYPKQTAAGPLSPAESTDPTIGWPPPMRGVPGPGYSSYPWHVLLYGHGDMIQRARIFILLVRQLRIDVVMLGIDTKTGRADPWLPAVVLENELFLFDTELGLAIPGPNGQGIATLSEVIDGPQLLESLDIGEKYRYRVHGEDLDKVVALIDASPRYLSQRMKLVEQNLTAEDQMVLAVSASDIKREAEQCRGVKTVRLWAVPFETNMYQQARAFMIASSPELKWQDFLEHGVFQGLSTVVRGRRQFLLGNLDKKGDNLGAAGYLLMARMSDEQIEEIEKSRKLQESLGLEMTPGMNERDWQQRIRQVKRLQVESKEHASYWLGLTHMERGDYDVAVNWLKTRTLESDPEGPWTNGARYNLARCYEELGRTSEAIQLYRIDESPQRHGNLVRAQQLEIQAEMPTNVPQPPDAAAQTRGS